MRNSSLSLEKCHRWDDFPPLRGFHLFYDDGMAAVTPDFTGLEAVPVAVLTSGGLDSAILVADMAKVSPAVYPLYIRSGLHWEEAELTHLRRYLQALTSTHPTLRPLTVLEQPVRDLYSSHWSLTGQNVPDAATPDEAVYLPGRNLLLILKALLWCHLHGVKCLALGVLGSNPFPDANPAFFQQLAHVVGQGVYDTLQIMRPYGHLHKTDVLCRAEGLPLEWSFSCIQPDKGLHCGQCNKCAERKHAFAVRGWTDPTTYAPMP
jgi:7-cyano-7-deazaguanine synthase